MLDQERVERLKQLITSRQDLEFFFEKLNSPVWIPLVKEAGLLDEPPPPVEVNEGVMFPFWPPSRYLVRIAAQDPRAVADVFYAVRDSTNPRVWWDTVEALAQMPANFTYRFLGHIETWVHHPYRLGLDESAVTLVLNLAAAGLERETIELGRNMAALVPPEGTPGDSLWQPLDDWDYETKVPKIARAMARFGANAVFELVGELIRHLEIEYPSPPDSGRRDLSLIWRPAIEDHEQNWDHDLAPKLVSAIRDGLDHALSDSPDQVEAVVTRLLGNPWPIVRRLGLHQLAERGDAAPALLEHALTDPQFMDDGHYQHEFYRLATRRFGELSPEAQHRYDENARVTASKLTASAQERTTAASEKFDADLYHAFVLRRWLNAVAADLDDATRDELKALKELTPAEAHPDFASYHMSWMGFGSPLTTDELSDRNADSAIDFLTTWREPEERFGPGPSVDGLAQNLSESVTNDPNRYVALSLRFLDLDPRYFSGFIGGLWKALEKDKTFEWAPVLAASLASLRKEDEPQANDDDRDRTWKASHITVARLLERGLEQRPGEISIDERDTVWDLLSVLAEDVEPTPEKEGRYGPPNMDPLTYSLNTVRGAAFHGIFLFILWHERHLRTEGQGWSIADRDPAATATLDAHLDASRDPSVAVRATYGWWLPLILSKDQAWVEQRSRAMFGTLTSSLELAAWETYLLRASGSRREQDALASYWGLYADKLAALDKKPSNRSIPGDPIDRYVALLILGWLHRPDIRQGWPLRSLLASGKGWIVAAIVEEAGRLIWRTPVDHVTPELVESYKALWNLIKEQTQGLEQADRREALSHFSWWFRAPLPGDWALSQLVELIGNNVMPDPDFLVLERLPDLATDHPDEALRVLDFLVATGGREWTLRTHEEQIRSILSPQVDSADELRRERARTLVHQLGRLGLRGLGSLVTKASDGPAAQTA